MKTISLVQECTNNYSVDRINDSEVEIRILIPKRFRSLWVIKLRDLRTDQKEIEELEDGPGTLVL